MPLFDDVEVAIVVFKRLLLGSINKQAVQLKKTIVALVQCLLQWGDGITVQVLQRVFVDDLFKNEEEWTGMVEDAPLFKEVLRNHFFPRVAHASPADLLPLLAIYGLC